MFGAHTHPLSIRWSQVCYFDIVFDVGTDSISEVRTVSGKKCMPLPCYYDEPFVKKNIVRFSHKALFISLQPCPCPALFIASLNTFHCFPKNKPQDNALAISFTLTLRVSHAHFSLTRALSHRKYELSRTHSFTFSGSTQTKTGTKTIRVLKFEADIRHCYCAVKYTDIAVEPTTPQKGLRTVNMTISPLSQSDCVSRYMFSLIYVLPIRFQRTQILHFTSPFFLFFSTYHSS